MLALFPGLYVKEPKNTVCLGVGYGIIAGVLAKLPGSHQATAVDVLQAVFDASGHFTGKDFGYHRNDRVKQVVADGRKFLASSEEKYDIIAANIYTSYTTTGALFFSTEFYEVVRSRLSSGGVLSQILWGPNMNEIIHTMREVSPYIKVIPSGFLQQTAWISSSFLILR